MAHEVPLLQSRQPVTDEDRMVVEFASAEFYRGCAARSQAIANWFPHAFRVYLDDANQHMDRARAHYSNAIGWASK